MSESSATSPTFVGRRNQPYARIWCAQAEPIVLAELTDALYARGFMPALVDPEGVAYNEAGLATASLTVGGPGWRFLSLTSTKGNGCLLSAHTAEASDLPDDYRARRTVPRPKLVYDVEASGPSNSDRNLCEAVAETLMLMSGGLVLLGGLGTKGNRPALHTRRWLGTIKPMG